jgi:dihydrofolate reductase
MRWPDTGEEMIEGEFDTKLSFGGQSITVPLPGWWAKEAGDGIVGTDGLEIYDRVLAILRARVAGLRITLVAAADDDWGIGCKGALPWRCPEDLRHFKARTMGKTLMMGRTTFEGLPRKLDGRTIHVVSRSGGEELSSADKAISWLAASGIDEIVVAGGGALYAAALPFCTHAEVTRIPGTHGCDAFMPDLLSKGWSLKSSAHLAGDIQIQYWEVKQ